MEINTPTGGQEPTATGGAKRMYRVLVVEDTINDIELMRATLAQSFIVETAMDGAAGYQKALEVLPDCIISDVRMPQMSGFTMLKKIRVHPDLSTIPVILLTALDEPLDKIHGYDLLADLYFTKPVDTNELLAAVKSLTRLRQTRTVLVKSAETPGSGITETDQIFLEKLLAVLHDNIGNFDLKVTDLAQACYVTRRQLERRLKKLEHLTPGEYIRQVRLEQAKKMLEAGLPDSIADLAHRVGFQDPKHFSKIFRAFYGFKPVLNV